MVTSPSVTPSPMSCIRDSVACDSQVPPQPVNTKQNIIPVIPMACEGIPQAACVTPASAQIQSPERHGSRDAAVQTLHQRKGMVSQGVMTSPPQIAHDITSRALHTTHPEATNNQTKTDVTVPPAPLYQRNSSSSNTASQRSR